jgi:hypothetical protein
MYIKTHLRMNPDVMNDVLMRRKLFRYRCISTGRIPWTIKVEIGVIHLQAKDIKNCQQL